MKRISTFLALWLLTLLAACGPAASETAVPSANESQLPTAGDNGDTAVSFTPAATVAEAAQLRDHDHTHGAAEPIVTIIEYGDFQ